MVRQPETYLITGGAGFIGCNLSARLLGAGRRVIIFDDLSRKGSRANLDWLNEQFRVEFVPGDVRRPEDVERAFRRGRVDVVVHQAAQVAVTTSVADPRLDFEVNALGTLNLLETARRSGMDPVVLFASTNKVYGDLADLVVEERPLRYRLRDLPTGVSEARPLAFHSPYGCSKGAADQYCLDHARVYGLRTVVFRQSCIYGPRQFGVEDQGWVAWFAIAAICGRPLTIYGTGKQVRDVLYIDDLIDAYLLSVERIDVAQGQVYNIGGGAGYALSLLEMLGLLERTLGRPIPYRLAPARPADQPVYISDVSKAKRELGWEPLLQPEEGVRRLVAWIEEHRELVAGVGQ